jgi:ribulose 1,5-bisphosphate carboxylase large subunit-like protein
MINLFRTKVDNKTHFIVKYYLESLTNIRDAAWNLAIGQSVGNPNIRNKWENDELFENHSCKIIEKESELKTKSKGIVKLAFPISNIDIITDGISQLLCQLMGGQMDIENIQACHLIDVEFPESISFRFKGPKFGMAGAYDFLGIKNKPILGGIIKPKIGITPDVLLDLVKEMVEGGINFIKEDEIMANPSICPLDTRVQLIMNYLKNKKVIYAFCINSDPHHLLDRIERVYKMGANAVHINFWCGLGIYKAVRDLNLPIFVHFQKSGDKILSHHTHNYHIKWKFICKLAVLMGVDFIHAGMIGGYYNNGDDDTVEIVKMLQKGNVVPALSCGMHPGLVEGICNQIGNNWMANCGGAIHGHPGGTNAGVKAMRQAINKQYEGLEYKQAIQKWGKHIL